MPTITTVDATWDTGATYDAAELRRADTTGFLGDGSANGVRGGIVYHGPTSLAVAVNGSDQVTVQPGAFVVPAATGLGCYRGSLATVTSAVALTARNATNPRIDLVVVQVTGTAAVVKTIDGTPGASPSAPALPAQHIELARLSVPAVAGGAVTVDSTWRSFATGLGGRLPVPTLSRLPGSGNFLGQKAHALDTGVEHTWDGTIWRATSSPGPGTTYGVTILPATGTFSNASATGRFTFAGRTLFWWMTASIVTAGTGANGVRLDLPANCVTTFPDVGSGRDAATGAALTATLIDANTIQVERYDGTSIIANGRMLNLHGTCELA